MDWYRPHVEAWSRHATPQTTLWFWNTEIGWANVHPLLASQDWEYRSCHIWDKGKGHVAGNANTKTLRKFPVVSEVCVQYVRKTRLPFKEEMIPIKQWLRAEWERSGLPLSLANQACGLRNAATRKYFTRCHLWYFPPSQHFEKLVAFVNKHGEKQGLPYFSLNGKQPLTGKEWERMRAKFHCHYGVTNVWLEPPVRGSERLKKRNKCIHLNQKPLRLLERIISASSDPGDTIWEPFGGLCSVALASYNLRRACFSAEILPEYYQYAKKRFEHQIFNNSRTQPAIAELAAS